MGKLVGVDPVGSILVLPEELNKAEKSFYEVEYIGYDFISTILHRQLIDKWYKTENADSLQIARELIKHGGPLIGDSSGPAIFSALKAIGTVTRMRIRLS